MFAVRGEDTQFERLLNALYYSALVYAIVFVVAAVAGVDKSDVVAFYHGQKSLAEDLAAGGIIALALPAAIATIGLWWRSSRTVRPGVLKFIGVSPSHSVSSGWNEAFSREGTPMLRVTLKDGRVVGGYQPQNAAPSPRQPPPAPSDSASSARPPAPPAPSPQPPSNA